MPLVVKTDNKKALALQAQIKEKTDLVAKWFNDTDDNDEDKHITQSQRDQVKTWNKEVEALEVELGEHLEVLDIKDANEKRKRMLEIIDNTPHFKADGYQGGSLGEMGMTNKSLGKQFTEGIKDWMAKEFPNGVPETCGVKSPSVDISDSPLKGHMRDNSGEKAIWTGASATSAGALVLPHQTGIIDNNYARPLTLLDLLSRVPIQSDTFEWVEVSTPTNAAAAVAEATNTSTGTKPESSMGLVRKTKPVVNIAHAMFATRRAVADASYINALINEFMMYGLFEEVEDLVATGDGVGENPDGIIGYTGKNTQAWDGDLLKTLRKAKTTIQTEGKTEPNAYVGNPEMWETVELLQDAELRYYFGGPSVLGTPRIWGLPFVTCQAWPDNKIELANWKFGLVADREQATMYMTDSHEGLFLKNILTFLAELRIGFGIIRPKAFNEIAGVAP